MPGRMVAASRRVARQVAPGTLRDGVVHHDRVAVAPVLVVDADATVRHFHRRHLVPEMMRHFVAHKLVVHGHRNRLAPIMDVLVERYVHAVGYSPE